VCVLCIVRRKYDDEEVLCDAMPSQDFAGLVRVFLANLSQCALKCEFLFLFGVKIKLGRDSHSLFSSTFLFLMGFTRNFHLKVVLEIFKFERTVIFRALIHPHKKNIFITKINPRIHATLNYAAIISKNLRPPAVADNNWWRNVLKLFDSDNKVVKSTIIITLS
jgi:hypothetical protein